MNYREKFSVSKIYFLAIALIFSAVIFLILSGHYRSYRSEVSLIFIPKSDKAALVSENILGNMLEIPRKVSFYDQLLDDNKNIRDNFSGLSDRERKERWNEIFKIKRAGKSSILNISVKDRDPERAEAISQAAAFTLFNTLSHYYDIKNDVDFQIIDEPNAFTSYQNIHWVILFSLLLGLIASFVFNFIFDLIFNYFQAKQREKEIEIPESIFEKKPEKEIEMPEIKPRPEITEDVPYSFEPKPKATVTPEKKAPAPLNLPSAPGNLSFIDEEYFRTSIIKNGKTPKETPIEVPIAAPIVATTETTNPQETIPEKSVSEKPASPHREPTQEELKKRLNQLLRGEL